jgi:protein-tyrosine phosphatase
MVCLGNICRSPMAEAVARAMMGDAGLGSTVEVGSFGTAGYHKGEAADLRAVDALRRRGWPPGAHRARQLTAADVEAADLVLCADQANVNDVRRLAGRASAGRASAGGASAGGVSGGGVSGDQPDSREKIRLLRSFDPEATPGDDEVPDPWSGGPADFDHTLELIERACRGLVAELATDRH